MKTILTLTPKTTPPRGINQTIKALEKVLREVETKKVYIVGNDTQKLRKEIEATQPDFIFIDCVQADTDEEELLKLRKLEMRDLRLYLIESDLPNAERVMSFELLRRVRALTTDLPVKTVFFVDSPGSVLATFIKHDLGAHAVWPHRNSVSPDVDSCLSVLSGLNDIGKTIAAGSKVVGEGLATVAKGFRDLGGLFVKKNKGE